MEIQWSLVLFAALSAWGAGTYAATVVFAELLGWAPKTRKTAFIISAVALIVGAIASMTHLGHIDRIFGVLSNPASGIFVEGLSAALLVVIIAIYLVAMQRNAKENVLKTIGIIGLVPALVLTIAVGSSYLMSSKPAWDVIALPVLSVGTAAVLGVITFLALASRESTQEIMSKLSLVAIAVVIIQAILVVFYLVMVAGAPYQEYSRSLQRIISGDISPIFWIGVVLLGLAVPLIASFMEHRATNISDKESNGDAAVVDASAKAHALSTGLLISVICVLAATIAFRVVMFAIGSSIINFGF